VALPKAGSFKKPAAAASDKRRRGTRRGTRDFFSFSYAAVCVATQSREADTAAVTERKEQKGMNSD
jgi:hypothetical protein